ncbi:MAG TPA: YtxH domain-containing protein [Candidatus Polarisedimenticolia bacterium]|nr:YtxH domain-containing protein [Candidatus Polarisedimenticolia bacterium]
MKGNNQGTGSWTGIVVSAVVGAAVGAGIALLFAPRTGKESRDWIVRSTRKIKDKAAGALEQAKDAIGREKDIARREAKEIVSVADRSR